MIRFRILFLFSFIYICHSFGFADISYKKTLNNRTYYALLPKSTKNVNLFIWCHPASGEAKPGFDWWKSQKSNLKNTILLCPQAQTRLWDLSREESFISELIEHYINKYKIKKENLIIAGHSYGAVFAYDYGFKYPDKFSNIISACGMLRKAPPEANSDSPTITIYHSTNDKVYEFKHAKQAEKSIQAKGYTVNFIVDQNKHSIGKKLSNAVFKILKDLP